MPSSAVGGAIQILTVTVIIIAIAQLKPRTAPYWYSFRGRSDPLTEKIEIRLSDTVCAT